MGKQDPYVLFKMPGQFFKTEVHDGGGKKPKWKKSIRM